MPRRRSSARATPALFPLEEEPAGSASGRFAQVALDRPMRCEYTYAAPDEVTSDLRPGMRVAVPFGRRREVGVVVGISDRSEVPVDKLKRLEGVLDEEPVVDRDLLELTRWMAERYACSWGEALAAVLPAPLKHERGSRKVLEIDPAEGVGAEQLATLETAFPKQHRLLRTLIEVDGPVELRGVLRRLNLSESPARSLERRGLVRIRLVEGRPDDLLSAEAVWPNHANLTPGQRTAVEAATGALEAHEGRTFLLQGVTGSGKTEVYLRVIERALELGRGAIVLVPEIALTPQTVGWFRSRFGSIAVLHSRMTDAQRLDMWLRTKRGEARVVVGARSAVFAPVADLGVIVVDEEHEPSFKQNNAPRYHARDVAVRRATEAGAICILGSATPSLETWNRAREGSCSRLILSTRIADGGLPAVEIVDMRLEHEQGRGTPLFSRLLRSLLAEAVEEGEQAILFLNRRGFTPTLWCPGCKEAVHCAQCDMSLTLHRRIRRLVCHGCCDERSIPAACPTCARPGLRPFGAGSERVEAALRELLPEVRMRRMDSDTMRRREDYEDVLAAFGRHDLDVLVGTQMIAKGLDFPGVTVVGIVSADQALHLPDFRAAERTFQLIAQVAGRAGRGERPGRIVVQTVAPEHPAIRLAARHDFEGFAELESGLRSELGYPPHGELLRVVFEDEEERRVTAAAALSRDELARLPGADTLEVLGPAPAPISLLRGRHRHHLLVKAAPGATAFRRAREWLVEYAAGVSRPRVSLDVDPASLL